MNRETTSSIAPRSLAGTDSDGADDTDARAGGAASDGRSDTTSPPCASRATGTDDDSAYRPSPPRPP